MDAIVYTKEKYTPLRRERFVGTTVRMEVIPQVGADKQRAAIMSRKKTQLHVVPLKPSGGGKQDAGGKQSRERAQLVSGRWLLVAVCVTVTAAAACGWLVLCLLFWQGSRQLLYDPATAVERTPANVGVVFDPAAFAATGTGVLSPQI
ncbi:MAG: hypothetical protein ABR865_03295 [Terracidiphilus sp.]